MTGMILQKIQMTQIVKENDMVPVTLLYAPKHVIKRFKTEEKDGYDAVVVTLSTEKQNLGELEIPMSDAFAELKVGDEIPVDVMAEVTDVTMTGVSKGKGFTGAMKRWNFKGGPGGHGSKFHRALGSIGTRKPRRTKPGKKMHGRHGNKTVTLRSVPVEMVDVENRVIAVRGPVPGARNSLVTLISNA